MKGEPDTRPERLYICKINVSGVLENTGEEVEKYEDFCFQLSDQEVVQGLYFIIFNAIISQRQCLLRFRT